MHVLIVDDDASSRQLMQAILEWSGHRVSTASDGVEALEAATRERPDLLITDILMPRMDGYQLCRAWKADERLAPVPVVFYTASYTDHADERFALELGADAFWRKPLEPRDLRSAVDRFATAVRATGARQPEITDEATVLKEYSARLVDKLEEKALGLEAANDELHRAMELLAREVKAKERLIQELNEDVAERERVESELRRERDFTRGVLELADLFICILDREHRITLLSNGAERLTGRRAHDVMGHVLGEVLVEPASREHIARELGSLPAEEVRRVEIGISAADGTTHTVECVITCTVDGQGRPVSYNLFGVDVTERRRLGRMKSEFIQTVSHELRTPLTSIIGFVDVLGQMPGDLLREQVPVIVEHLRENAGRMRGLIEELLEVNDIAAEGVELALRSVDLGAVVKRSAEAVYRGREHVLTVTVDPALPPVRCDADRIARVVTNLVANAIKYSPDGGPVDVSVTLEGSHAAVSVSDRGVGIAPEELDTLWDRFSQADMSSTRSFGGLGLGLFIVAEIVRAHGGSVGVASRPGEGSTFTVRLPLARGEAPGRP